MAWSDYKRAVLMDKPAAFYPLELYPVDQGADDFGRQIAPDIGPTLDVATPVTARLSESQPVPMTGCPPCLNLDGAQSTNSTASADLNTTAVTMEIWCLFTATPGADRYLFTIATSGNPLPVGLRYYNSNFEFLVGDTVGGAYLLAQTPFAPTLGRWVHLVGSTDGSRADIWIDRVPGIADTTTSGSRPGTTQQVFVGRYNSSFSSLPNASVACAAIYPRYDITLATRHFAAARRADGWNRNRRRSL